MEVKRVQDVGKEEGSRSDLILLLQYIVLVYILYI